MSLFLKKTKILKGAIHLGGDDLKSTFLAPLHLKDDGV